MRLVLIAACAAALATTAACGSFGNSPLEPEEAAPVARTYTPPPQPPRSQAAPPPVRQATSGGSGSRIALADDAPNTYVVVRGDTLWDISDKFLAEPWRWPEIWYVNEQIENPHLIFPGDRLTLIYVDGVPQLRLDRGGLAQSALKLSPQIRRSSLDDAITTIPYEVIAPFLSRPTVLTKGQINRAPYLLQLQGDHLIGGQGLRAYVRGKDLTRGATFSLMHVGDRYVDPDTGRTLGREALYVGQAQVEREGDPATVLLTESAREALAGDILLPLDTDIPLYFYPTVPEERIQGSIVDVVDGVSLIGQYQVVVLNRGGEDGLQQGHVLEVFQRGEKVRDRFRGGPFSTVRLPQEYAGRVLVFRVLDDISYALVMSASSEMRVADIVRTPGAATDEELREERRMAKRKESAR